MDIRNLKKQANQSSFVNQEASGTSLAGMRMTTPTLSDAQEEPKKQSQVPSAQDQKLELENHDTSNKTLVDEYREFLLEKEIDDHLIFLVLDNLLTNGTFYWQFKIFDKIEVVFRVRSAYVNSILVERIEKDTPKTVARFQDIVNTYNLAGTLFKYQNTSFNTEKEEEFSKALAFIKSLPYVVVQKLVQELIVFDRLMFVVSSDWAIENFTKPSSEEQEQTS